MAPRNSSIPPVRLSVVIPTFNYARFLPAAIRSVLDQTVPPLEILVADDGSTDDTAEVVKPFGERIRYFRLPHAGVYAVRTRMLREIQGEWFLNLDADNRLAPDFIAQMEERIRANAFDERFAFAYPDMELFGDSTGRVERPEFDVQRLKRGNYIDMNSVIRTDVARKFGFDPAFNSGQGDYDFFLTLAENGYRGERVARALLHYRTHEGSISQIVGQRRNQMHIMRRMVRKHSRFFTPDEARQAIAAAANRLLVGLITTRSPFAGPGRRWMDGLRFAGAGWRHAEFRRQLAYGICPQRYFMDVSKPADVFYLFRDTAERRAMIRRVLEGETAGLAGEQLFGFDRLAGRHRAVDCNLRLPRVNSVAQTVQDWMDRRHLSRTGIGLGDGCSLHAHLGLMNRARAIVATTDNTGFPAARLKAGGRLVPPLLYVSVGLPERMKKVQETNPEAAERCRRQLACVDRFAAYGWEEAIWLRHWLGADEQKVRFIPFGVDTVQWKPVEGAREEFDVVSIGNDSMRDFGLLVECARRHPEISFCVVTSRDCAHALGPLPENVQLQVQLPVEELKDRIAGARMVVLPVRENTYSGATTTLLQCLSMGKTVAVSRVGAIREGYGFEDGIHLQWMEPDSLESMERAILQGTGNPDLRAALGRAARRHVVERLDWDSYVIRLSDVWADWVGGRSS